MKIVPFDAWHLAAITPQEAQHGEVEQVRGHDIGQAAEHGLDAPRKAPLPVVQHLLDLLALQVGLRAAKVAGNDGKVAHRRPFFQVAPRSGLIAQRIERELQAGNAGALAGAEEFGRVGGPQ